MRLSEIGQSYTGVSALLSAGALIGVVASIQLQTQQIAIARSQAARDMHFGLLQLAMNDPAFSSLLASSDIGQDTHERYRRDIFRTQWFRYYEFSYSAGEMSEDDVRSELILEFFPNEENREWWSRVRSYWEPRARWGLPAYRRFIEIVDEAHGITLVSH